MNARFPLVLSAIALCSSISIAPLCAQSIAPPGPEADPYLAHYEGGGSARYDLAHWNMYHADWAALSTATLAAPGPEADRYLEHTPANVAWVAMMGSTAQLKPSGPEADPYMEHAPELLVWASQIDPMAQVGPIGPEADPYMQHYVANSGADTSLTAIIKPGTWKLVDYETVASDGQIQHPLGYEAKGYMLISPERYVAIAISSALQKGVIEPIVSYMGKLDFQNDKSIHPLVSTNTAIVGVDQVKTWHFSNGQLTLTAPANADGSFGLTIWQMVK